MSDTREAKTVAVKACLACSGGLLEYDRFCRWCGSRQTDSLMSDLQGSAGLLMPYAKTATPLTTSALEPMVEAGLYRRVSGPLVSAVVAGVSANASAQSRSLFVKRAILALISLPIWLIIVLLSPFDAYAAAKNLLREN
jgi:hypothetical protein